MSINVPIPSLGESVTEVTILKWLKEEGEYVNVDEPLCELETDKANVSLPSPAAGKLERTKKEGDVIKVGEVVAKIAPSDGKEAPAPKAAPKEEPKAAEPTARLESTPAAEASASSTKSSPSMRKLMREHDVEPSTVKGTGPHGRVTKDDVMAAAAPAPEKKSQPMKMAEERPAPVPAKVAPRPAAPRGTSSEPRKVPMTKIRKKIAERLVNAQHQAAMLTTFNEIDMSEVMALRERFKTKFSEKYGVGLGITTFFARAATLALLDFPVINAAIDGEDVAYHDYVNLAIAVSTDRGLLVPVLRNAEQMNFATVENEIKRVSTAAREGKLGIDELSGGTFTITNGGVFGSLMSTPILNAPQSAILGLHAIQKRPVVRNDQVVVRPMMYVALSYDHRLIDGKDSVSFLVRVKELMEDPARLMLEV